MSKKRFIIIVTFVAGLYFFLEFVVPGLVPGTKVSGTVARLDWGEVTYELSDGTVQTHADKPVKTPDRPQLEAIETKRRNVLDEMQITDLKFIRPGDVVSIGGDRVVGYGDHAEIRIGATRRSPVVEVRELDGTYTVRQGQGEVQIGKNRKLKIDNRRASIWRALRYYRTQLPEGSTLWAAWVKDLGLDLSQEVTIAPGEIKTRAPDQKEGALRKFLSFEDDEILVLGSATEGREGKLRLEREEIRVQDGYARIRGQRYSLTDNPLVITPRRGGAVAEIAGARVRLSSSDKLLHAGLVHPISINEYIELTLEGIVFSQRGVVRNVVPARVHIRTASGQAVTRSVSRSQLILKHTVVPQLIGGQMFEQKRVDEAKVTELRRGDRIDIGQTTYLTQWLAPVGDFLAVVGTFGIGLGMFNLAMLHGGVIRKRGKNWLYSIILFVAMFSMLVLTYFMDRPDTALSKQVYNVLFDKMLRPMGSTTFSLLAFYLASAAYRAFKIKTAEAAVMSLSAVIVMLGQVPIGVWLTHWGWWPEALQLQRVCAWILYIGHTSAYRAVMLGAMVGAIAMGLRLWFNLERGAFFDREL